MDALLKPCDNCEKPMNGGVYRAAHVCPHCLHEHEGGKVKRRKVTRKPAATPVAEAQESPVPPEPQESPEPAEPPELTETADDATAQASETSEPAAESNSVFLTSKPADEQTIVAYIDTLTAECVLKLKLTSELFENGKFLGSKSDKVKAALKQGQKHALAQLRQNAQQEGANLVSDVAIKNAIKKSDDRHVSIIVKATGNAARAELPHEAVEA